MPKIAERFAAVSGDQDRRQIRYLISECASDIAALNFAETHMPLRYDNMPRENITVTEVKKLSYVLYNPNPTIPGTNPYPVQDANTEDGYYYADAIYTRNSSAKARPSVNLVPTEPKTAEEKKDFGKNNNQSYRFSFGTQNVLERRPPPGVNLPLDQATGFGKDGQTYLDYEYRRGFGYQGPEKGYSGAEVLRPTGSFVLSFYPANERINDDKRTQLEQTVGKINLTDYWNYTAGSLLCTAVTGSGRTTEDWQIDAEFQIRPVIADLDLGNGCILAAGAQLPGWALIDVEYFSVAGPNEEENYETRQATAWGMYDTAEFNTVFDFPVIP